MPSLKSIRKRISSVKNTQQITKAMKMVSASKLRRAQERITAFSAYANKMHEVVSGLAGEIGPDQHPLLRVPEAEKRVLVIVVSSDRGLCGAFNANAYKRSIALIEDKLQAGAEVDVISIGKKANDLLRRKGVNVRTLHTGIFDKLEFTTVCAIVDEIMKEFLEEKYDGVWVVYNHFISAIAQQVRAEMLLPLVAENTKKEITDQGVSLVEYIYEPGRAEILDRVLPQSVRLHLYKAVLDSIAAEHGARMSAMDSASTNAKKAIGRLTLQYNRARQAAITKELMEIVSGAESLK
jgi:F-type H+-transporting ATPase subunit gamma